MPLWRRKVERFLETNQLRLDEVDYYAIVTEPDGDEILAGGGLQGDIIKCIAVSEQLRDAHLSNRLISHLISEAAQRGHHSVKVFTKPQNRQVFESLGFRLVGEAPLAILMENGHGMEDYKKYLQDISFSTLPSPHSTLHSSLSSLHSPLSTTTGVIVMNANPFTLGHKYLIEKAAAEVDHLFIIPVKEERSLFPYAERKAMIEQSLSTLRSTRRGAFVAKRRKNSPLSTKNGAVLSGSDYAISAATFPTYFLKQLSDATDTQMLLDIDIFCRHIAPALGATVRFVGSEPTDALTRRYNELLAEQLPKHGLRLKEIPRLQTEQAPISATTVRSLMAQGMFVEATKLVPPTTIPYLLAHLACDALQQELDTTPKPGLVDQHDSGAHADMDYRLMQRSIHALRPYFVQLAQVAQQGPLTHPVISAIGIEAERAMLAATGGVNTHRGALFSMGLAIVAASSSLSELSEYSEHSEYSEYSESSEYSENSEHSDDSELSERPNPSSLQSAIAQLAQTFPDTQGTHGSRAVSQYQAKGALAMAREGYEQLFSDWLPFLHNLKQQGDPYAHHKTLLRIMGQLDDTNILHRCGAEVASRVKAEAADMLAHFSTDALDDMNRRYSADNISPGGSADMLALTIFTNAIMTR